MNCWPLLRLENSPSSWWICKQRVDNVETDCRTHIMVPAKWGYKDAATREMELESHDVWVGVSRDSVSAARLGWVPWRRLASIAALHLRLTTVATTSLHDRACQQLLQAASLCGTRADKHSLTHPILRLLVVSALHSLHNSGCQLLCNVWQGVCYSE